MFGLTTRADGLVGEWMLLEGDGSDIWDYSGNGLDGRIQGQAEWVGTCDGGDNNVGFVGNTSTTWQAGLACSGFTGFSDICPSLSGWHYGSGGDDGKVDICATVVNRTVEFTC